jgi:F-type H+-transporting ATPase subunit alpha
LTELLKQPQYTPYTIERQIIAVFAGTSGFFDNLPLAQVLEVEKDLLNFVFTQDVLKPFVALFA